jgi:hypothetical protein
VGRSGVLLRLVEKIPLVEKSVMRINTRALLIASTIFNGMMGLLTSFLPQEVLKITYLPTSPVNVLLLQILSAFYIGLAMINFMSKDAVIGGIYNRPILMGNIAYHSISSIALVKYALNQGMFSTTLITMTVVYCALSLGFLRLFFVVPGKQVIREDA